MSCGCKNKNNGQAQQPAATPKQTAQQPQTQTVQESIKKVVEKYYGKKR
jgi:hypothetical protein